MPHPTPRSHSFFRNSAAALALTFCITAHTLAQTTTDSGGGPIRKKLIELGWGTLTPARLLEHQKLVEQTPFDGLAFKIVGTDDDGKPVNSFQPCTSKPWKREWFQTEIDTLKRVKSTKLTDNFISVSLSVSPSDFVDAFDDAGWKTIVEKFRTVAWIAKQGGLKGLMLDPESYSSSLINSKSRQQKDKSFDEYAAKVRQRGREVMQAVAAEYPDMVFFTLFMNSGSALGALGGDPREVLQRNTHYALYPAFVNGWLDVVPERMTIVDGFEMAYPHSDEAQYLKHVNAIRNTELGLVAPENRQKYRGHVQAGLPIYMDAYVAFPKSDAHPDVFTDPPLQGSLVDRLKDAACSAMDASDEYVWIYNEQYRWWPNAVDPEKTPYWDEILPGASNALRAAADPLQRSFSRAEKEFAVSERKASARGVPLRNLVKNGDFNNGAGNSAPPALKTRLQPGTKEPATDWELVPGQDSKATLQRVVSGYAGYGSACVEGPGAGMFVQEMKVNPQAFYKVRAWTRQMGTGQASIRIGWRDAQGQEIGGTQSFLPKQPAVDQWRQIIGTVRSPAGATAMILSLAAKGETNEKDKIWFDDVEAYAIDVN